MGYDNNITSCSTDHNPASVYPRHHRAPSTSHSGYPSKSKSTQRTRHFHHCGSPVCRSLTLIVSRRGSSSRSHLVHNSSSSESQSTRQHHRRQRPSRSRSVTSGKQDRDLEDLISKALTKHGISESLLDVRSTKTHFSSTIMCKPIMYGFKYPNPSLQHHRAQTNHVRLQLSRVRI
ncbi:hypothetical protein M5689_022833 [Euphorbia peplus]|nr:hypothetical protein M5689_022833 [Euphorbia peplus]